MTLEELAHLVSELAERVARLEQSTAARERPVSDGILVEHLLADLRADDSAPDRATVVYAGAGPWGDGTVAWQMGRDWADVLRMVGPATAQLFAALGNPLRLRIVSELLVGQLSTGELADRLDQPSSGQLFHHLKELLGAGAIHQPVRGTYAIRPQHVVPLLGVLAAAIDVSTASDTREPS